MSDLERSKKDAYNIINPQVFIFGQNSVNQLVNRQIKKMHSKHWKDVNKF